MEEDLDLLCNSLNAAASLIAPTHIKIAELLLRAQAVISEVKKTEWKDAVNSVPTIEERVVGKWVYESCSRLIDETDEGRVYTIEKRWHCSRCGFSKGFMMYRPDEKYCPNCGARMKGE